jgi:uncharacterized protein YbjT (DUF2867 family)
MLALVTGATGYIGGRLVENLLDAGVAVRVLVRDPARIGGRSWAKAVQVAVADLADAGQLGLALRGAGVAFYLVHSMYDGANYAALDRRLACNFAAAARAEVERGRLRHVVYLGGLQPEASCVSRHLASRAEVGGILRDGLPCTEFRAGPIIGSGSASFEMVRYLTERLPVILAPRWVHNEIQPVAVRDVLSYLALARERQPCGVVEIGGDRLTFRRMIEVFARARGLRRLIVPAPVFSPRLAGQWVGLLTPVPATLAVPLLEGIIHPVVADTARARQIFPEVQPISYRCAVELALARIERGDVRTRWSGALGGAPAYRLTDWEGLNEEVRSVHVGAPPERVFRSFSSLGGDRGWLAWNWAWRARGRLDRIIGGPGLRRGRRHPQEVLVGDTVDFWRVEEVRQDRLLRLRAEMRLPGRAWLQWEALAEGSGTRLVQTALFAPVGLWGSLYWYGLYPFHRLIFDALVRAVAHDAERGAARR